MKTRIKAMMQSEIGLPLEEVARAGQATTSATQKQIVDRMLARSDTTGMTRGEAMSQAVAAEDTGVTPVRETVRATDTDEAPRDRTRMDRQQPGWPDSLRVQTLASIVREVLASTDDIPPEEDFTTMLLQKLEEAGLDTSAPIVDYYA